MSCVVCMSLLIAISDLTPKLCRSCVAQMSLLMGTSDMTPTPKVNDQISMEEVEARWSSHASSDRKKGPNKRLMEMQMVCAGCRLSKHPNKFLWTPVPGFVPNWNPVDVLVKMGAWKLCIQCQKAAPKTTKAETARGKDAVPDKIQKISCKALSQKPSGNPCA